MYRLRIPYPRLTIVVAVLAVLTAQAPAAADDLGGLARRELLAKAAPDECFVAIGEPYPPGPPCATGQAKVNQAYVWGLTRAGDRLWFGTGPNVHCLVSGGILGAPKPSLNRDWVCEYGESQMRVRFPDLPAAVGDWRPPHVFVYDTVARSLVEKTADIVRASEADARRLTATLGIRAAGSHEGVALLGGPSLLGGINLFAFDTATGGYLGSATLPAYSNIRKFLVADGVLYTGVGVRGGVGGSVLRWTGDATAPFRFVEVGALPGQAAELTVHEGRIFVSTWPNSAGSLAPAPPAVAGLWTSPPLADGEPGLTPEDAASWRQVWSAAAYEPDPLVAASYGGGALASYGGDLYWGTMHVPLLATVAHLKAHPPADRAQALATVVGTQRAIAIFRGRGLGGDSPRIDLLYGQDALPAFDPVAGGGAGAWRMAPTGYTPRFGRSGFGNPFNNYTWTMAVAGGRLLVGTMDWSYLASRAVPDILGQLGLGEALPDVPLSALGDPTMLTKRFYGADLWAFRQPGRPAVPLDVSGVGNYLNYGLRTMVPAGSTLYVGTANPMNLRTDPTDDVPEGGWELLQLQIR